jgi:thiol:disulfide interchange protein DsbD
METVKSLFGVALLAAAGVFLKDASPAVRPLFSAAHTAGLWAAAAAGAGVLLGALHASFHGGAGERVLKAAGVLLAVGGIVYAAGAANARERAHAAAAFTWLHSEEEALRLAKAEGRPVILDFWADWCTACKELDRTAWSDARVREAASRFVAVKVDGTDGSDAFQQVSQKYGVLGMPAVIFIDPQGREVPDRVTGAIDASAMIDRLRAVDGACAHAHGAPDRAAPPPAPASAAVACVTRW